MIYRSLIQDMFLFLLHINRSAFVQNSGIAYYFIIYTIVFFEILCIILAYSITIREFWYQSFCNIAPYQLTGFFDHHFFQFGKNFMSVIHSFYLLLFASPIYRKNGI